MKALIIALTLLFAIGCTVGIRIESCPPVDAAWVDDEGAYHTLDKGFFNNKRNWWEDYEPEFNEKGELIK